jgi:hypothetical protein
LEFQLSWQRNQVDKYILCHFTFQAILMLWENWRIQRLLVSLYHELLGLIMRQVRATTTHFIDACKDGRLQEVLLGFHFALEHLLNFN